MMLVIRSRSEIYPRGNIQGCSRFVFFRTAPPRFETEKAAPHRTVTFRDEQNRTAPHRGYSEGSVESAFFTERFVLLRCQNRRKTSVNRKPQTAAMSRFFHADARQ
ncbi:unnamed protein product, partial [Ectocarpus sp. 12 AP-2014]